MKKSCLCVCLNLLLIVAAANAALQSSIYSRDYATITRDNDNHITYYDYPPPHRRNQFNVLPSVRPYPMSVPPALAAIPIPTLAPAFIPSLNGFGVTAAEVYQNQYQEAYAYPNSYYRNSVSQQQPQQQQLPISKQFTPSALENAGLTTLNSQGLVPSAIDNNGPFIPIAAPVGSGRSLTQQQQPQQQRQPPQQQQQHRVQQQQQRQQTQAHQTSSSSSSSSASAQPSAGTLTSLNVKLPLPLGITPINLAPLPLQGGAPYSTVPRNLNSYGTTYPLRKRRDIYEYVIFE